MNIKGSNFGIIRIVTVIAMFFCAYSAHSQDPNVYDIEKFNDALLKASQDPDVTEDNIKDKLDNIFKEYEQKGESAANQVPPYGKDGKGVAKPVRRSPSSSSRSGKFPSPPSMYKNAASNPPGQQPRRGGQATISKSNNPARGINVQKEVPSVRHVTMSPASRKLGGDDVEIIISPIFEVLMKMPNDIEFFKTSSSLLTINEVQSNPNLITLKLSDKTGNTIPISLHLVDTEQQIYTFTIIGEPADLDREYPKTIIVNKRRSKDIKIGLSNPTSILEAMDINDAVQLVVGDVPETSEYNVKLTSLNYMHHKGYAMYGFQVFRKDKQKIPRRKNGSPALKFTIWANDKRLNAGNKYSSSKEIEWTIEPLLSKRDSRRNGTDTIRVFVQIKASILDLEDWTSAFITVSDSASYTRHDFKPMMRSRRAPMHK